MAATSCVPSVPPAPGLYHDAGLQRLAQRVAEGAQHCILHRAGHDDMDGTVRGMRETGRAEAQARVVEAFFCMSK